MSPKLRETEIALLSALAAVEGEVSGVKCKEIQERYLKAKGIFEELNAQDDASFPSLQPIIVPKHK